MSSHHALAVPDIVHLIFDEIGEKDRPTLAQSAQCCRAFHDTALNMLWKTLDSVVPLRKLLPDGELGIDGPPASVSEEQWKRFDSYAQRVRMWVFDERGMDAMLYCYIATVRPGIVPFPFLRKLQLFERIDTPPIFLLPTSLRYLHINFSYWHSKDLRCGEQYLVAAIDQVPNLEELKFYGPVPSSSLARCADLKCLLNLQLDSAELPPGSIAILSSLPALTVLELPRYSRLDGDIPPRMGFDQLESFTLSGHPSVIVKLLETITSPKLGRIAIHNSPLDMYPGTFTEWNACFECIRDRFGSFLRAFEIKAVAAVDRMSTTELLQPLMDLYQLRHLVLSGLVQSISTEGLLGMAFAWPHLRYFAVHIPPIRVSPALDRSEVDASPSSFSRPSESILDVLVSFARLCPDLSALAIGLAIDDDQFPPISQFPALSHNLRDLRLAIQTPSEVKDYMPLARLLDRLFPVLETIEVNHVSGQICSDVPYFNTVLQAARMERCFL